MQVRLRFTGEVSVFDNPPDADIDDKIIARAKQADEDPLSLSRRSASMSWDPSHVNPSLPMLPAAMLQRHCLPDNVLLENPLLENSLLENSLPDNSLLEPQILVCLSLRG